MEEIEETEEEKSFSVGSLKEKYIKEARRRFLKVPPLVIVNKQTNWAIEVSNRVISEWRSKSRTRERIIAIQVLDTMIETAVFLKTTEDEKNTPGIEEVSYFENKCRINGKLCKITITIKKQTIGGRRFAYYYSAVAVDSDIQ
ncbi:hypothetical protein AGMMS4952_03310 [Spirochaetia bacterium]|nr:hypothetical protein AGMMS4952_03310 [Spirochaetia bacterium]